ncbi:MAG: hypothetical protein WCD11_24640 [Solirubrobacteraceae bacterium]
MKRFASLIAVPAVVTACLFALAGGAAAASAASALPTLNLALTGKTGISVSGSEVSGAVNVVSTFTGKGQGQAALVRLNPALPPAQALAQGFQAVQSHHGDLNALTALGDALVFDAGAPGTAQTVLTPGAWVALNVTGSGNPVFMPFTVSPSSSPAALPTPGGTVGAIEFGFRGASVLHRGELVRFENDGYLVHMVVGIRVKNRAVAAAETAALLAGKDKLAMRLASGFANFAGPLSPGGMQQEVINAKPGVYVLACFMNTQDGREHTQIGMERTVTIR